MRPEVSFEVRTFRVHFPTARVRAFVYALFAINRYLMMLLLLLLLLMVVVVIPAAG